MRAAHLTSEAATGDEPATLYRRSRPWGLRLFAIVTGLLLGGLVLLCAGEVVVRVLEPPADTHAMPLPGAGRGYGFAPHASGWAGGVRFHTNAAGLRGPEWEDLANGRPFVIAVLGDSYAFGYGVRYMDAFPAVLEATLRGAHPQRPIRVIDLALPGYNTAQELATLQEFGARLHPDLILLAYHLNDIERPDSLSGRRQHSIWHDGLYGILAQTKQHLHVLRFVLPRLAVVSRALHLNVKTTATAEVAEYLNGGPAWQANQDVLRRLFAVARNNLGASMATIVVPYLVQLDTNHTPAPAYEVVRRFCESNGIPSSVALPRFLGRQARSLWISALDGHPNIVGHRLLADDAKALVERTGILATP